MTLLVHILRTPSVLLNMQYLRIDKDFYVVLFCELKKREYGDRNISILGNVLFLVEQTKKENVSFLIGQMEYMVVNDEQTTMCILLLTTYRSLLNQD